MVDHSLLLSKLYNIGFRGNIFNWFASYLSNRSHVVNVNDVQSNPYILNIGVPQGSVLGPLLFLLYVNSFFKLNLRGSVVAFADDVALSYHGKNSVEVSSFINNDLFILRRWFDSHSLILSEKTKVMFYKIGGPPVDTNDFSFMYHAYNCCSANCISTCISIECVTSFVYLGMVLDSSLNWKLHVDKIKNDTRNALRILYLLRRLASTKVVLRIYYALIYSRMEYGLACFGACSNSVLKPLATIQKHAMRIICFKSSYDSSWPLFLHLKVLPLQHLFVFKVLRLFFLRSGHRNLRLNCRYAFRYNQQFIFNIPAFRTEHSRKYFLFTAPSLFNQLPLNIRQLIDSKCFLKMVKQWLFERPNIDFLFNVVV